MDEPRKRGRPKGAKDKKPRKPRWDKNPKPKKKKGLRKDTRPVVGQLCISLRSKSTKKQFLAMIELTRLMEKHKGVRPSRLNEHYLRMMVRKQIHQCQMWFIRHGVDWRAELGLEPPVEGDQTPLYDQMKGLPEVEHPDDKPIPTTGRIEEFYGGVSAESRLVEDDDSFSL